MTHRDQLPRELVFDGAHLTEVGAATLVDGEELLVPADVRAHVLHCETCQGLLAGEAHVALRVAADLEGALVPPARPMAVPASALVSGALVAAFGAALAMLTAPESLGARLRGARELGAILARGARAIVRAEIPPSVTWSFALALVAMGAILARVFTAKPTTR